MSIQNLRGEMMSRFILFPLVLCLLWWAFLSLNGLSLKQGEKGFYWILAICAFIAFFFAAVIHITQS